MRAHLQEQGGNSERRFQLRWCMISCARRLACTLSMSKGWPTSTPTAPADAPATDAQNFSRFPPLKFSAADRRRTSCCVVILAAVSLQARPWARPPRTSTRNPSLRYARSWFLFLYASRPPFACFRVHEHSLCGRAPPAGRALGRLPVLHPRQGIPCSCTWQRAPIRADCADQAAADDSSGARAPAGR